MIVDQKWIDELTATLPELALAKKRRFVTQFGLPAYDAGVLVDQAEVAAFYEDVCALLVSPTTEGYKLVSNWIMTDMLRLMGDKKCSINDVGVSRQQLASLVHVLTAGSVSSKTAKELFPDMIGSGKLADEFISERGLTQISDEGAIRTMVESVIRNNPDNLKKYLDGKSNLFGFFVGQVLKASGGSANPTLVSSLMKDALDFLHTSTSTED